MPVPKHIFNPPFNVVRCSHAVLRVRDLVASRRFYEDTVGLKAEDAGKDAIYFRGMEERNHHSLVLKQATEPAVERLGFKVGSEEDLDRAHTFFKERQLPAEFVDVPFQGRTLHATDTQGNRLELYFKMAQAERILQQYGHYKGCQPQRLDHFNVFAPDVQGSIDFYASLGFRLTEYSETDDAEPKIAAAWMHRKGSVHDLAFTHGKGPRLHHIAYWVPTALSIIHLCDVMATTGYLANMERGPGRHGISNAFFLYVRDPDGHRVELYTSDYLTVDPDHEPLRWSIRDPRRQTLWGTPAPRSWFEEGSTFPNVPVRAPLFEAQPIVAD
ncbi:MAG: 3,4-dihydroxyphenylacetate 2,3-dioxygenase [Hyphomicrobiaceae bacterium]|nr:MAG: 3,4-dihydroxyphenylacetate 2,3-dioxygenase [Hyphomicrobiaceae bacterium]